MSNCDSPPARRVVYTCVFGYSEAFADLIYDTDPSVDFVCFTDMPELESDFWRIIRIEPNGLDPARAAKQCKILAHRFLCDYTASLYIDNTVRLKIAPTRIFELLDAASSPLVCFRHPWRSCIYDEAREVLNLGFDTAQRVDAQMRFYRALRYPENNGLWKGAFLLRRHSDPELVRMMETWFEHVWLYSRRDQLSLPVAAWLHDFEPEFIGFDFLANDMVEYPYPSNPMRLPRGFDDEVYLRLNPDVRLANINPRRHYMTLGADQGRRFR